MERYLFRGQPYTSIGVHTFAHEIWFESERDKAGLVRIEIEEGETAEDFAQRIHTQLCRDQRMLLVLGGLLVPEGTAPEAWTPELAEVTAAWFGGVTDEGERQLLRQLCLSLLISFFESGASSLWRIPRSSVPGNGSRCRENCWSAVPPHRRGFRCSSGPLAARRSGLPTSNETWLPRSTMDP